MKLMGIAATAGALAPFIPYGQFVSRTFKAEALEGVKVANVDDAEVRQPGSTLVFSYPRPAEEDPFSSSVLLHLLPKDAKFLGTEFMAFNRTCVHLRCLYNYSDRRNAFECPCHGSVYRSYDAVPIAGPAHSLGLNPEPEVVLKVDENGDIFATELNGIIGFGRERGWTHLDLITPKKYAYLSKELKG